MEALGCRIHSAKKQDKILDSQPKEAKLLYNHLAIMLKKGRFKRQKKDVIICRMETDKTSIYEDGISVSKRSDANLSVKIGKSGGLNSNC